MDKRKRKPDSPARRVVRWLWVRRGLRSVQIGMVVTGCISVTLCSLIGVGLNIIPDATESAATRVARLPARTLPPTADEARQEAARTPTVIPTVTPTITNTPVVTPSATITDTIVPTDTPTSLPTDAPAQIYYTQGVANLRDCPKTNCAQLIQLPAGLAVRVIGTDDGENYKGSTLWYRVSYNGQDAYIHSSLVATTKPVPTSVPVVQATPVPVQPPSSGSACGGATTCGQMVSCDQAYACLREGNGGLDRDKDGVPCESICPGG